MMTTLPRMYLLYTPQTLSKRDINLGRMRCQLVPLAGCTNMS